MGCTHSVERRGNGANGGGQQPLQAQTSTFLSRLGVTGRYTARANNAVPVPEGLFTGAAGGVAIPAAGLGAGAVGFAMAEVGVVPPHRRRMQPAPKMHNTQTVRSLVNLKKHTLKIHAEEGAPGRFSVSFIADSTLPSRAFVYIMAYEKDSTKSEMPPRLKSKATKREASLVIPFCGLDQTYSTPTGQGLNLEGYPEEELTVDSCTPTQVYPLVIRLQVVPPSTSDKSSLQAQTSFASLVKQSDGSYEAVVLKQVLWVSGTSYVLHEIFGIDRSSDDLEGGESEGANNSNKECVICMVEDRDTLALPCRHLCLCSDCAKALGYQSNKCPICRSVVQSLLQIKLGERSLPQVQEALNKDQKLPEGAVIEVEVLDAGWDGDGEGEGDGERRDGGGVEGREMDRPPDVRLGVDASEPRTH